jgi:hypothetical protein
METIVENILTRGFIEFPINALRLRSGLTAQTTIKKTERRSDRNGVRFSFDGSHFAEK